MFPLPGLIMTALEPSRIATVALHNLLLIILLHNLSTHITPKPHPFPTFFISLGRLFQRLLNLFLPRKLTISQTRLDRIPQRFA